MTFCGKVDDYLGLEWLKNSKEIGIGNIESDVFDSAVWNIRQPTVVTSVGIKVDIQYLRMGRLNSTDKA